MLSTAQAKPSRTASLQLVRLMALSSLFFLPA